MPPAKVSELVHKKTKGQIKAADVGSWCIMRARYIVKTVIIVSNPYA